MAVAMITFMILPLSLINTAHYVNSTNDDTCVDDGNYGSASECDYVDGSKGSILEMYM